MDIIDIKIELRKKYRVAFQIRNYGIDENIPNAEKLKIQAEYNYEALLDRLANDTDYCEQLEKENFNNIDEVLDYIFN